MGLLSIYFKPNFLGLLKCLNKLNWFIVFFSLINLSVCIYEDQIGKFDWRQTYVGRIKFSQFDTVSTAKKIIVATEENVLAALNLKTGQVVWRHVFESASTGNIQLLQITEKVVTVSGSNPYLVRGWNSATGVLQFEWSLTLQNDEQADFSEWWVQNDMLVHMLPVFGSHIEVTMYNLATGQNKGSTTKLPAVWSNDGCIVTAPYYTCIHGPMGNQQLFSLDVTSNTMHLISQPLSEYVTLSSYDGNLRPLDGNGILPAFTIDDKKIIMIKNSQFEMLKTDVVDPSASVAIVDVANGPAVLQTWIDDTQGFSMRANSVSTGAEVAELRTSDRELRLPDPEVSSAVCTKSAREQLVCRVLLTGGDDSVHLMQQGGRILWSREEALANVVAAEFVELPVSDLDAAIESEFDQKEGSIWAAFSRRLQTQFQQLQTLVHSIQSGEVLEDDPPSALVRDYFGLHKIIVLVTDVGKIFGMDNLSGSILWQYYESSLDTENVLVYTRRTARHPPHDAYLTVVGKHEETGNGLIISLNPITGSLIGERVLQLDVQLLQVAVLHKADNEKLHALILLDKDENVQILPQSAAPLVENMFMYVAERNTARVQGYAIIYNGQTVEALRTWLVQLGGSAEAGHRIVAAAGKPGGERVHSPGRVLADRSVLYKYVNPNLVLFVTEGPDPLHKDVVVATCVDAASGAIIAAQAHRRARALPYVVHTEHYLAYLYYNDKHRRTEIATVELYEGKQRWSGAGAAFTSLWAERAAAVERLAYILPAAPAAAAVTHTERSLTDKHVLLALTSGAIVEVPWAYLEGRRGGGEEGAMLPAPAPEIMLAPEARLNYNRTLARPRQLYTAPAGLESTSLVLATGLDLFYTRVAPSKTFDLLKDDFDYYLITIVLAALIVATYSTKYFASRKMLKLAWK
ncbi:ER membrane protein complex subunit 1 isoform X2 [Spodoptera frugiperda]|uniref:ER membrane protein complex subunit 1 n=1 Tax=Spodoptera frugiperda TaxID=7108 RepID=A0A9R0EKT9_SPOFR|nr:ER membrane protein complex subunit 1 isoform X2 [Spodoptera frugiperda]